MSVKGSILKNIGAGTWSKLSNVLFRLVQVPLLISALGVEDYGRWLVLASLPAWIRLANFGFGNVAANEMSMLLAANEVDNARKVYSTTLTLTTIIGIVGGILATILVPMIPWEGFIGQKSQSEISKAVYWLAISVFVSFLIDVSYSRFRAARKAHLSVLIGSFMPWVELLLMVIVLRYTTRFDYLGLAVLGSTVLFLGLYQFLSRKSMPLLTFSLKDVQPSRFRDLFWKGMAFQAFPLGNALVFQGNLLIIQAILGPYAVTVFGTTRTLIRTINQAMELVNQAIWPEMSHLFGSNDMGRASKLHRLGVGVSIIGACIGTIFLMLFGKDLYGLWVGKNITISNHLLIIFLIPIPFNAVWFTSSVVHLASNKHEGLAIRYLLSTLVGFIACIVLCYFQGIEGAALSTIVADLVLIPYVLKNSLILTEDTWKSFSRGILLEINSIKNLLVKRMA
ncbi:lipopolysaccharide biosynthesis protein [Spirosoma aerolatum]|uniref:lipopolysaccharide biosynthesis protein n=1 Tax=Spirosoma aerolatum TaxID=1211326 RepID=UPI0009AEBA0C|nr:hypothetical protein [Spirosoma aerolatum]